MTCVSVSAGPSPGLLSARGSRGHHSSHRIPQQQSLRLLLSPRSPFLSLGHPLPAWSASPVVPHLSTLVRNPVRQLPKGHRPRLGHWSGAGVQRLRQERTRAPPIHVAWTSRDRLYDRCRDERRTKVSALLQRLDQFHQGTYLLYLYLSHSR